VTGHDDAAVLRWQADDPDPGDVAELNSASAPDLAAAFAGPLRFGTAGLRGPLRAGPNGMNTAVVRRTTAGLASYLRDAGFGAGSVVAIGYDGRHRSADFARDCAAVFAAAGFDARLLPTALPTPVLAYAVRALGAVAGVMITASHNPPADNGYKVYADDGAQIISPADTLIEAAIAAVGPAREIALSADYQVLASSLVSDYIDAITALLSPDGPRDISVVHTALHGVGTDTVRSAFVRAGFARPISVPEQAWPDPDFPTVAFPNPEEPGAMDLALALAVTSGADLVIANDPDADRCAVGVPAGSGWRMLSGDELGVLIADWLIHKGVRGTYATSIVSSSMLSAMAARNGVGYAQTLTGFKWISRAADDLVFGYEEALGYAVAPGLVKDKDGVSAALLVAEMAAHYKANGSSLLDRLAQLAAEYGPYLTRQLSWRVADISVIAHAMSALRGEPPTALAGSAVTVTDLLPANDVLIYKGTHERVVIRPSGTEPKLKAYLEVNGSPESLTQLAADVSAAVGSKLPLG
jgi:phosphomannomutase